VKDYIPVRDERSGKRGIRILTEATDYFTFLSSNHCWDFMGVEKAMSLSASESLILPGLRDSALANPLTVAVSVVLVHEEEEFLLMQRRNQTKNFHGKQDFVCGAAGMVSATRDLRSGLVDVYATAVNELREETGIQVSEESIHFLALARETGLREIGLLGEVTLNRDPANILRARADAFESVGFVLVSATPEDFAQFVSDNLPTQRFSPLSAGSVLFSLLRRFSLERIESAFADLNVPAQPGT